jgi:hypothetical protein
VEHLDIAIDYRPGRCDELRRGADLPGLCCRRAIARQGKRGASVANRDVPSPLHPTLDPRPINPQWLSHKRKRDTMLSASCLAKQSELHFKGGLRNTTLSKGLILINQT